MSQTFTVYLLPLWLFCLHLTVIILPPSMDVSTQVFYSDTMNVWTITYAICAKSTQQCQLSSLPVFTLDRGSKGSLTDLEEKTVSITVSDI